MIELKSKPIGLFMVFIFFTLFIGGIVFASDDYYMMYQENDSNIVNLGLIGVSTFESDTISFEIDDNQRISNLITSNDKVYFTIVDYSLNKYKLIKTDTNFSIFTTIDTQDAIIIKKIDSSNFLYATCNEIYNYNTGSETSTLIRTDPNVDEYCWATDQRIESIDSYNDLISYIILSYTTGGRNIWYYDGTWNNRQIKSRDTFIDEDNKKYFSNYHYSPFLYYYSDDSPPVWTPVNQDEARLKFAKNLDMNRSSFITGDGWSSGSKPGYSIIKDGSSIANKSSGYTLSGSSAFDQNLNRILIPYEITSDTYYLYIVNNPSDDSTVDYNFLVGTDMLAANIVYGEFNSETPIGNHEILNPTDTIYPLIEYDWNGIFRDVDYNSDYTYYYDFGFNENNTFDGSEFYVDSNSVLDYDSNELEYFDLNYTATSDQIGDSNYSFFRIYRYFEDVNDYNSTSWSEDTFTVYDAVDFNFNNPEYPDWVNVLYPTKSYGWSLDYNDSSYEAGRFGRAEFTYYYDFGVNDTNGFDGNEIYRETDIILDTNSGVYEGYIPHTLEEEDNNHTYYAFLKIYRYNEDELIDYRTNWTDSFDVNYGRFRVQVYDENCGDTLDGNVHFENDVDIPVDENGLIDIWLYDYIDTDGESVQTQMWREVEGVVTHTTRDFDYYLYLTRSYDLNVALLPVDMGWDIEFLAKDMDDNLWVNKYLMFVASSIDLCPEMQELISTYGASSGTTTNTRGIRFSIEEDCYMTEFEVAQNPSYLDTWELWNYTLGTLVDTGTLADDSVEIVETYGAKYLDTNYEYSLVFYNEDGSAGKFVYSNNYLDSSVVTDYISYDYGCSNGALDCTSTDAFAIKNISVIDANNYNTLFSEPIIETQKLDSGGKGTFYVLSDGNYSAILVDEIGSIITQYLKTTVNLSKPKDEITLEDVSPYDVDVGGLLSYSVSNQTATDINFNIFGGTVGYYDFSIVDYNATPTDRDYIPRTYSVRIPFGSSYTEYYELQPYLISDVDGIIPRIKVLNQLNRAVENAQVIIYKYIDGTNTIVESKDTDSTGSISFSAYPLDEYSVAVYYNDVLKANATLRPRTSDDIYYITIDLSSEDLLGIPTVVQLDWGDTVSYFNPNSMDIEIDDAIISSNKNNLTGYTLELYQDDDLVDSNSYVLENTNTAIMNYVFDTDDLDDSKNYGTFKITVSYGDGLERVFYKKITITTRDNPFTYFVNAKNDLGQPLAVILSIFLTGLLIALLSFSGLPLGKLGVAVTGVFIMGFFMWIGWLDSGVTVLGFDVSRFMFVIVALGILYFAFKEGVR